MPIIIVAVLAGTRVIEPFGMVTIPRDRFADAILEADLRTPAKFALNFRAVKRIAAIMPRAVLNITNQGIGFAEVLQNRADDFQIGLLYSRRNIVNGTGPGLFERQGDGTAIVFHEQPVALLQAIAINRERLVLACVGNHQRD